jgi:dolichol-phosphate mannosyltransferase
MISIVVPAYNERGNIESLVERAGAALAASGASYELIIVDDNSPDGTAEVVGELQRNRPWLHLIVRTKERGLSSAVIAGWNAARGEVLGCMDADLQHPPEVLTELVQVMQVSGADVVVGSRNARGGGVSDWSLSRRFVSWTATVLATLAVPGTLGEVRDPMSGFFLLRRDVILGAALKPRGYKILLEALAKGDYTSVKEVPFVFQERAEGGSKIGSSVIWDYIVHLFQISIETGEAARAAKFMTVGLSGAVVNLLAYRLLTATLGWAVWQAAAGSAALAIANNFIWNERFTFPETRKALPGARAVAHRFGTFSFISLVGLALNVGVVEVLVGLLRTHWLLGVVAGISIAGAWNFFANANFTWEGERKRRSHAGSKSFDPAASNHEPVVGRIK